MKEKILILTMIFFTMNLHGQTKITEFEDFPKEILMQMDNMGKDTSPILTQIEGMYFNIFFKNSRKDFNFCGKKMAFLGGSLGKVVENKKTYFYWENINVKRGESPTFAFLYIFNEIQKKETGGYDVAIMYWNKKYISIESVVKTLKKEKLK
jgi:hypothetical protein